ncbi:MAG: polysaccharide deacetylase family protein [Trueperaceae bacterium]|nr:polysaccharide deacetylase family protein [Trueperaceae bacterium]
MSPRASARNGRSPRALARRIVGAGRRLTYGALGRTPFGSITSVVTDEPLVAITFDGCPDPQWTPRVLEVLDAHGAKGTFFAVGKFVDQHPDVMRRLHESGHALGNHTYDHPSMPLVTRAQRLRELRACEKALAPYPQPRKIFRPPYLDQDFASRLDTWRLGYDVIACSLHATDWEDRSADEMVAALSGVAPGDVIMLHDVVCDQRYRSREAMITALDTFLRQQSDLRFVSVPTLLDAGRPRREMWLKRPNVKRLASYERDF